MIHAAKMYSLLSDAFDEDSVIQDLRSYSGRAMYGSRCIGVTTEESEWRLAMLLARLATEHGIALSELPAPRSDSMGRSAIILYWPSLDWDGDTMEELGND